MSQGNRRLYLDEQANYQITVQGKLDQDWSASFNDMDVESKSTDGVTITVLTGIVADQAALHGLLARIRDLGLPLLAVEHKIGGET